MADEDNMVRPHDAPAGPDAPPPPPIEEDIIAVDIHKPKPFHGWREFLKEYGIIVLGVLTALAGEQVVEDIHHRSEMHEAREALKVEIESNLWSLRNRINVSGCVTARLNALDRWAASQRTAHPLRLEGQITGPTVQVTGTSVWRIATASVIAQMPFEDRVYYARLYDTLAAADGISERMMDRWRELALLSDGHKLGDAESYRAQSYIRALIHNNEIMVSDARVVLAEGVKKGLVAKNDAPYVPELLQRQRDYCRSNPVATNPPPPPSTG